MIINIRRNTYMKKIFSNILQFFKALAYGLYPSILGFLVTAETYHAVLNIIKVTSSSGWSVVGHFVLALIEIVIVIFLLWDLGLTHICANNWIAYQKHKQSEDADNIDSHPVTDTVDDVPSKNKVQSKSKRKKCE
jgi:hypothetical protein